MERFQCYKKITFDNTTYELDTLTTYFYSGLLNRTSIVHKITPEEEARPDKISLDFYGNYKYWWAVLVFNNIIDPFSELVSGRVISLPSEIDLLAQINGYKKVNK
jgi:hypothetical protein